MSTAELRAHPPLPLDYRALTYTEHPLQPLCHAVSEQRKVLSSFEREIGQIFYEIEMHFCQKEMKENIWSQSLRFPSLDHRIRLPSVDI